MRNSKMTSADRIAIVTGLTSSLEAGIERHAAIDEQRCTLDVVGFIAGEPNGDAPNFFWFADAFVGNQLKQLIVMLRRILGLHFNRFADGASSNGVNLIALRCDVMDNARHSETY